MRPIIGITAYVEPASWGVWHDLETTLLPHAYVEAVTIAGGRAVLLPPDDLDADVLSRLDGLVLAGGPDLGSDLYGAEPEPLTDTRPARDAAEMLLARAALDADLPILGVCRGMQVLAVAAGGRLHQHLPDVLGHEKHRPAPGVYGTHAARFTPGSRIAGLMGDDVEIHCYHHQGVADPGTLTVTGRAEDGLPEAIEHATQTFVLGVQWHPEVVRDKRLFGALITAAG
jgi:putative glutamine amidotransferase